MIVSAADSVLLISDMRAMLHQTLEKTAIVLWLVCFAVRKSRPIIVIIIHQTHYENLIGREHSINSQ